MELFDGFLKMHLKPGTIKLTNIVLYLIIKSMIILHCLEDFPLFQAKNV